MHKTHQCTSGRAFWNPPSGEPQPFLPETSLRGRVIIIKQLLMPIFVYPAFIYVCPSSVVSEIQNTIDSFLWKGKSPKVPRHILELPIEMGGLNLPNVARTFSAIRLTWTRELFKGDAFGDWDILSRTILSTFKDHPYLNSNIFKTSLYGPRISVSNLP